LISIGKSAIPFKLTKLSRTFKERFIYEKWPQNRLSFSEAKHNFLLAVNKKFQALQAENMAINLL